MINRLTKKNYERMPSSRHLPNLANEHRPSRVRGATHWSINDEGEGCIMIWNRVSEEVVDRMAITAEVHFKRASRELAIFLELSPMPVPDHGAGRV